MMVASHITGSGSNFPRACVPQHVRLFVIFAFLLVSGRMQAQDSLLMKPLALADTTISTEAALKLVEKKTGMSFSYNSGLVNRRRKVSLSAAEKPLQAVLEGIFDNPSLSFSIIGGHIVVYESKKVLSANPSTRNDTVYFFEVRGTVLEEGGGLPLPYSSVYLLGKAVGTVTNDRGQFVLRLNSKYLGDTLGLSCVGYHRINLPVSSLINTNREYRLKPDVVSIQEVIIRQISAVNLLQSASEAISDNYSLKPAVLTSFYRETVKKGGRYRMVSEAILENYKGGYGRIAPPDQVKILRGRKSQDISGSDSLVLKLKAGLNTMLLLDVVKNMPDFLTGDNLQDYTYKMNDIVVDNSREQYVIEFLPRYRNLHNYYTGRIMLDVRNLAYTGVEFSVDPERLDQATGDYILKKPADVRAKVLNASYKVSFRKTGGSYYLYMIQCETSFKLRNKNEFGGSVYSTTLEMAVTDIDTVNTGHFRFRETARLNDFFTDQLGAYDESFWGEYNFIRPDDSLEAAIEKLRRVTRDEGRGTRDE
jgi:hypothetical protein